MKPQSINPKSKSTSYYDYFINNIVKRIDNTVANLNTSKAFAGLMIIVLNIGSRFVTIKLSKTMESYLKYTFSKQILIFAIAWMGTRDIYIAFFIMIIFTIFMEYLFNEESQFCCLPNHFTTYHVELLETEKHKEENKSKLPNLKNNSEITDEDIQKAKDILEKAGMANSVATNATSSFISGNYSPFIV